MIHAEFDDLRPGDQVMFEGNSTVYTVLGKTKELIGNSFVLVYEQVVSLSPNDDNYVRRVGMFDEDVKRMSRVQGG